MNKVSTSYKSRRDEIFGYYKKYKKVDMDNILDINDKVVDKHIKKENFEHPLEEFYNMVSMCLYMIENDLYDEYFFDTYEDILEEYDEGNFDDYFLDIKEDKKLLDDDIYKINEYLAHEESKMSYYDNLSEIYTKEANK